MTSRFTRFFALAFAMSTFLTIQACSDDPDPNPNLTTSGGTNVTAGTDPAGTGTGTDGAFQCDPKGANPQMGDLLNAPLKPDVTVIQKTPGHPGNPGPNNLPQG